MGCTEVWDVELALHMVIWTCIVLHNLQSRIWLLVISVAPYIHAGFGLFTLSWSLPT
jgi:hypothetical protein